MDQRILLLLKEGQAFARQSDWQNALVKWNEAIDASENPLDVQSWVATLLAGYGQLGAAKAQLEAMADADPTRAAAAAAQIGLNLWEENRDWQGALQLMALSLKIAGAHNNIQQLAFTSGNLGNIVSAAGSLEASLIHYGNAAKYYLQLGDTEWASMMWSSAGGVLKDLERFAEAEEMITRAKELAAQNGHDNALTLALLNLGSIYGVQEKFYQSQAVHLEALRIAWQNRQAEYVQKSAGNLALDLRNLRLSGMEEATELTRMAIETFRQKQYDWAIFGLKYAALLVDRALEPIGLADIFHTLSNIEFTVGEMEGATVHLQEACQIARDVQNDGKLAVYGADLSRLYLEAGKLKEAAAACDEAIAAASKSDAREALTAALGNRGIVAFRRDELNLAEQLFRRQYLLAKAQDLAAQCANAANALGAVYRTLGDLTAADTWFDRAIEESDNYQWPAGRRALGNKAILLRQRGEAAKAIDTFQDALIQSIGAEDADGVFDVLLNLGMLYAQQNQPDQAKAYFDQAREWSALAKDPRKDALLAMNEAYRSQQAGQTAVALEQFQQANDYFRDSDWENYARCSVEIADLLRKSEKPEEALQQILPAVRLYEQRMDRVSDYDAWRLHRKEEHCFQVLMELMLQIHGPERALLAAERTRGRAFRLALRRQEAGHRTRAFDYMQILRQTALEGVISGRTEGLEKAYIDRLVQVLSGAKDPQEFDLNEAWIKRQAGQMQTTIVVYAKDHAEALYAWVIDAQVVRFTPIDLGPAGGLAGLTEKIRVLRKALGIPERGARRRAGAEGKDSAAILAQLYQLLIAPVAAWLPDGEGGRICFVPWGPLFEIPFCALIDEHENYLVEKFASFVAPTLYFFGSQREENGKGALIVGDPLAVQTSSYGELAPLPFAETEARQVAAIYQVEPVLGAEATKGRIRRDLPDAGVVHFAAHGLLNEIYPLRSAVALTQTEEDDGLLYAADLKTLSLNSRLVVLSACATALGAISGDGVLGLCREFLTAGTDSVVASLWAVGDRSSAFHMAHFHRELREKPAVEALRAAQLATKESFDSVAQWGAYVLWGWPGD